MLDMAIYVKLANSEHDIKLHYNCNSGTERLYIEHVLPDTMIRKYSYGSCVSSGGTPKLLAHRCSLCDNFHTYIHKM